MSTLCTIYGKVIAIGGHPLSYVPTSDTFQLCNTRWEEMGTMNTNGCFRIVAVLTGSKPRVVVVGGSTHLFLVPDYFNSVEIAELC